LRIFLWHILTSVFVIFEDVPDALAPLFDDENKKTDITKNSRATVVSLVIACWIVILIVASYSFFYFMDRPTFFTVSANVEQVSVSSYNNQEYPDLKFNNAILHEDCGEKKVHVSGALYPHPTTFIDFLRIQKKDLIINLDNEDGNSAGVFIEESGKKIILDDCASILVSVSENESFVFPVQGKIKLGGNIKEGTSNIPLLYSGEISIIDKALLTRIYYSVGPFDLNMGDVFNVEGAVVKSSGFVQVDDEKGIKITYSSKGSKGYIKKYRTESITIENGFWTKIYNDQSLFILWFVGGILFALCKARIRISLTRIEKDCTG